MDDEEGSLNFREIGTEPRKSFSANRRRRDRSVRFHREHTFLGRRPAKITCPNCLTAIETIVERHCTLLTHLTALLMLPFCLCPVPYCTESLRDAVHRCPSCGIHLGCRFGKLPEKMFLCCRHPQQPDSGDVEEEKEAVDS